MAKITRIRPPQVSSANAYRAILEPPLGLAYIAAALESAGHSVHLVDAQGEALDTRQPAAWPGLIAWGLPIDDIVARVADDSDAIGLSIMFSQQWPHAEAIMRAVHARWPTKPIFVGGEHATATWDYLLTQCPEITACALGEGELTAIALADWLDGKHPLESVAGIAIRDSNGKPTKTVGRVRFDRLEKIPWPAWHLVPLDAYFERGLYQGVNRGRSLPMLATRGCPFQCTFCSSPAMWTTRYAVRPVGELVDEIESYVARYGISNVDFEDLTAFIKRDWVLAFCAELERRGVQITYQLPSGTRSEVLDSEVLRALYRTGCRNITYAPESGSTRTLRRIKKKIRLERMIASMKAAVDIGMVVKVNMIIGFPFETRKDILETLQFTLKLARLGVEDIPLYPFCPYPGTEIYDELRRDGLVPELSNAYFASLTYNDLTQGTNVCERVGATEITAYRIGGMAAALAMAYTSHPSRIFRTFRNLSRGTHESMVERRLAALLRLPVAAAPAAGGYAAMPPIGEQSFLDSGEPTRT
jgi:radical SAM superfamily enzyme YgiQ (UPF0313 family)